MVLYYSNMTTSRPRRWATRGATLTVARSPGGRYAQRKARERAARGAGVLAAARRLFARKGYQRSTMVAIAAASELALGTLYQLFPSKEAILCRLLEEYMDGLIAQVRDAVSGARDAEFQLERIVRTQLVFSQNNADVLRLYLSGWIGYEFTVRRQFGERIDTKYEEYLGLLAAVFRRGSRDGVFVAAPPRRLAITLAGMIHALIRRWLRERTLNLTLEGTALLPLILHGVTRRGGDGAGRR
jgi:AcrR family transcriptional regulator